MIKAYFYTLADAEKAQDRLDLLYRVTDPEPAEEPVNGRPWVIEIELPEALSLSPSKYPDENVEMQVLRVTREYDGIIQSA